MMYRIIKLHHDGRMENDVVDTPDYYALGRAIDKCEIKSFTVALA